MKMCARKLNVNITIKTNKTFSRREIVTVIQDAINTYRQENTPSVFFLRKKRRANQREESSKRTLK